jgi:hypothetical protein
LIEGGKVKKINGGGIIDSSREEFEKVFDEEKGKRDMKISGRVFSVLKKTLGEFEVNL